MTQDVLKKIAVLAGGWSHEREVSLVSGQAICAALKEKNYDTIVIDPQLDVVTLANQIQQVQPDVVFNALHGIGGEDGVIQSVLTMLNLPFTHSGVAASALAMDKRITKNLMRGVGVPVAMDHKVTKNDLMSKGHPLDCPYVLKPVRDGSSIHTYIIRSEDDLQKALEELPADLTMMAEKFVSGRELTVGVLHLSPDNTPQALGVTELKAQNDFYDYEAKYQEGLTEHILSPDLSEDILQQAKRYAINAHNAVGCAGLSRSDFRYNEQDGLVFLEVNTQPGFTPLSLFPEQAKATGIAFNELVEKIAYAALAWHGSV